MAKKTARIVCTNDNEFWTTQKQFWLWVREGLVDEFLVYMAPKLIGVGRELALFGPLSGLDSAPALAFTRVDTIGADLRILARPLPSPSK